MKKIADKIRGMFSNSGGNTPVVNDAPRSTAPSEKEINRRIDMAAKHTVKEYGQIIERLSKE